VSRTVDVVLEPRPVEDVVAGPCGMPREFVLVLGAGPHGNVVPPGEHIDRRHRTGQLVGGERTDGPQRHAG